MTVSSTTVKNSYSGNSSTTVFAYSFKIFADSDLQVIIRSSTGTETTKTLTTHYTVSGAGDASGGNVTFTSGNTPATGETVVIRRGVPQTQAIDYIANDPFPAESHEEGLDRATMTTQQVQEELNRSIKLSRTNTMTSTEFTVGATDRANKVLAFDASGEISIAQELGTFKGNSATTTTAAFSVRDIIKATTTAQLNNIYICIADSVIGDALTDTDHFAVLVDAVAAGTSATASATSATASASSATAAASSASTASTQASNASTSATNSANSATAAASSATDAANSADAFDDIYLGSKSSDPSTDNDGDALAAGMLYFNTTTDFLRVYTGSAWQNAAVDTTGFITLSGTETLTNKTLTTPKIGTSILDTNGNELAKLTATGSAVNEFTIANAASGAGPKLSSTGETNVDLDIEAKGTGHVTIRGNTNPGTIQFNCESNSHGQQLKAQPHSVASSAVHTLPNVTGELMPGKIEGTNFTDSLLVGHATTGTLDAAEQNVGVGIAALDAITSGDNNTAVGYEALTGNQGGSNNTGLGHDALKANNDGNENTAIGSFALDSNSSGDRSVAIGDHTLATNSSGGNSTAIGRSALETSNGNYNIGIGANAGDNISSGSGNVIIGTVDAASATGARQLKIAGYDGSTTTTWITGDSSGNVSVPANLNLSGSNKELRFYEGANFVGFEAPALSGDQIFVLPAADGSADQVLKTDGSGNLGFATAGGGGKVNQVVSTTKVDTFSESTSNGVVGSLVTGLTVSITPSASDSKIMIFLNMNVGLSAIGGIHFQMFRGTTHIDLGEAASNRSRSSKGMIETDSTGYKAMLSTNFLDSPSSTSSLTYSVKLGHTSGSAKTIYVNRDADYTDTFRYPTNTSTITAMEILA